MYKPVSGNPDFPAMEKDLLDHWYTDGIVEKYLKKNNTSDKRFSFIDGPITANNPMGVHHAWGRSYKDLWQKFFNLLGHRQRFQNGFDCQGLWVEVEVEKELKLRSKKEIENIVPGDPKASIAKFVQMCKDRVLKFAAIQTEQTKRLGNFMDWDNSYFTMSPENNYMIWHFLKKCFENGWIYKGHESVPWCPRCETAISQHEMLTEDYKELTHESIYFELPVEDRKNEYLLVWTTTPWTLPANIAVAVDVKLNYSLVEGTTGDLFWIATDAVERVFGKDYKQIVKTVKGSELVGLKYRGPFDEIPAVAKIAKEDSKTFHTVIPTDDLIYPISAAEGTGLVHTAVSAGVEDFKLGKKLGLPYIEVIADNADYLPTMGILSGKNAKKHPEIVFDYLKEREKKHGENWIFLIHRYTHRYPACWRCKTELVWKIADEWYIGMDIPEKLENGKRKTEKLQTFREMMVEVAKKIKWMPEFGLDRELDWLANMHDWLISKKNRYWGLALPIYECSKCGSFEVIGSYDELKTRAVRGWESFEGKTPHKPYIDEVKIKCGKCGETVSRIPDVGNPWLDAGIVPYSTISKDNKGQPLYLTDRSEWEKWFPADFITESFPGQFKNWFYALIAMSTAMEDREPFKMVLGYGTLLGEDGRPMHKSWGNSIEFNEGADKIGVDVMRWMYARQSPADNMLFGYKKADEVRRQFYLMLWNSYRFFVEYAILDKFELAHPESQDSGVAQLPRMTSILDKWILARLYWLINFSETNLKKYNAKDVALETERFVNDLSTWYIRRSRDRVWTNSDNDTDKQSFYSTLHLVLVDLSIIISPIMPFISEMIYTNLTDDKSFDSAQDKSVHLSSWPTIEEKVDEALLADMELVREIVEIGHRARKESKMKVRQTLAKATVSWPKGKTFANKEAVHEYLTIIKDELNVVEIELKEGDVKETAVVYDLILTAELKEEGEIRELIRMIQVGRKKLGLKPDDRIDVVAPKFPEKYMAMIKRKVLARQITIGENLSIAVV